MVPDDQDAQFAVVVAVDDRVGKVGQWVNSSAIGRRRSNARVLFEQHRHPLKFVKETPGESDACLALVEPNSLRQVCGRKPVDGALH